MLNICAQANCEIIPAKRLFFKTQKVTATGYYGIENPLPDVISIPRHFWGAAKMLLVGCQVPLEPEWLNGSHHYLGGAEVSTSSIFVS